MAWEGYFNISRMHKPDEPPPLNRQTSHSVSFIILQNSNLFKKSVNNCSQLFVYKSDHKAASLGWPSFRPITR